LKNRNPGGGFPILPPPKGPFSNFADTALSQLIVPVNVGDALGA